MKPKKPIKPKKPRKTIKPNVSDIIGRHGQYCQKQPEIEETRNLHDHFLSHNADLKQPPSPPPTDEK